MRGARANAAQIAEEERRQTVTRRAEDSQRTRSSRAAEYEKQAAMARGSSVQIAEVEKRKTAELKAEISERGAAEKSSESPDGRDKRRVELMGKNEGGSSAPRAAQETAAIGEAARAATLAARAPATMRSAPHTPAPNRAPASSKKRETAQVKAQIKSTARRAALRHPHRWAPAFARFPTCSSPTNLMYGAAGAVGLMLLNRSGRAEPVQRRHRRRAADQTTGHL